MPATARPVAAATALTRLRHAPTFLDEGYYNSPGPQVKDFRRRRRPPPGGLGLSEFTALALFGHLGYEPQEFVPFLLLVRVVFYAAVILLYAAGRVAGKDLPVPAAGPVTG